MTNKELQDILSQYPDDYVVMYRHNKYGRINIDIINCTEEALLSGKIIKCLTLEGDTEDK